ncbi:MAG: anthranilate synthase component I family protein, partial [Bacteroidetes bacterium]|nr:anthranilate synthase component I family protein [Bacteroidota bacterium]MBU1421851.1 anthranilate synthase component I family protein [Bacteroidota bacterium]
MEKNIRFTQLEINITPFELFKKLHHKSGTILLESTMQHPDLGRRSIIVTDPIAIISFENGELFESKHGNKSKISEEPLDYINSILTKNQIGEDTKDFSGGFVGYFSYDFGCSFENVRLTKPRSTFLPDLFFGFYKWGLTYDHYKKEWKISGVGDINKAAEKILQQVKSNSAKFSQLSDVLSTNKTNIQSNILHAEYLLAVHRAKEYIAAGDIYQVNLSQQFSGNVDISPLAIYERLREMNPAPFSALMCIDENDWVMSSSPELFLDVQRKKVETRPIKGTAPRSKNIYEDVQLKNNLYNSIKDNAELLMIVDLERNDLNRVCKVGTVKVPELKMVETYASVHHLVAQVCGELREENNFIDLLTSTFPGGSITGAPKIRAMQIINELEPNRRGVYTGTIGYFGFNKTAKLNIA